MQGTSTIPAEGPNRILYIQWRDDDTGREIILPQGQDPNVSLEGAQARDFGAVSTPVEAELVRRGKEAETVAAQERAARIEANRGELKYYVTERGHVTTRPVGVAPPEGAREISRQGYELLLERGKRGEDITKARVKGITPEGQTFDVPITAKVQPSFFGMIAPPSGQERAREIISRARAQSLDVSESDIVDVFGQPLRLAGEYEGGGSVVRPRIGLLGFEAGRVEETAYKKEAETFYLAKDAYFAAEAAAAKQTSQVLQQPQTVQGAGLEKWEQMHLASFPGSNVLRPEPPGLGSAQRDISRLLLKAGVSKDLLAPTIARTEERIASLRAKKTAIAGGKGYLPGAKFVARQLVNLQLAPQQAALFVQKGVIGSTESLAEKPVQEFAILGLSYGVGAAFEGGAYGLRAVSRTKLAQAAGEKIGGVIGKLKPAAQLVPPKLKTVGGVAGKYGVQTAIIGTTGASIVLTEPQKRPEMVLKTAAYFGGFVKGASATRALLPQEFKVTKGTGAVRAYETTAPAAAVTKTGAVAASESKSFFVLEAFEEISRKAPQKAAGLKIKGMKVSTILLPEGQAIFKREPVEFVLDVPKSFGQRKADFFKYEAQKMGGVVEDVGVVAAQRFKRGFFKIKGKEGKLVIKTLQAEQPSFPNLKKVWESREGFMLSGKRIKAPVFNEFVTPSGLALNLGEVGKVEKGAGLAGIRKTGLYFSKAEPAKLPYADYKPVEKFIKQKKGSTLYGYYKPSGKIILAKNVVRNRFGLKTIMYKETLAHEIGHKIGKEELGSVPINFFWKKTLPFIRKEGKALTLSGLIESDFVYYTKKQIPEEVRAELIKAFILNREKFRQTAPQLYGKIERDLISTGLYAPEKPSILAKLKTGAAFEGQVVEIIYPPPLARPAVRVRPQKPFPDKKQRISMKGLGAEELKADRTFWQNQAAQEAASKQLQVLVKPQVELPKQSVLSVEKLAAPKAPANIGAVLGGGESSLSQTFFTTPPGRLPNITGPKEELPFVDVEYEYSGPRRLPAAPALATRLLLAMVQQLRVSQGLRSGPVSRLRAAQTSQTRSRTDLITVPVTRQAQRPILDVRSDVLQKLFVGQVQRPALRTRQRQAPQLKSLFSFKTKQPPPELLFDLPRWPKFAGSSVKGRRLYKVPKLFLAFTPDFTALALGTVSKGKQRMKGKFGGEERRLIPKGWLGRIATI